MPEQLRLTDLSATNESQSEPAKGSSIPDERYVNVRGHGSLTQPADFVTATRYALELEGIADEYPDDRIKAIITGDEPQPVGYYWSDQTNHAAAKAKELLNVVREHRIDDVVAVRLTQLMPGIRDAVAVTESLVKYDVAVHLVEDKLVLDPGNDCVDGQLAALRSVASAERRNKHRRVIPTAVHKGTWRGQPPLGFTTDDEGILTPSHDYEQICSVLEKVADPNDNMSKRRAASLIGCTRRTITRAIQERPEMYGLNV